MKKVYKISNIDKSPKTANFSKAGRLLKNRIVVRYIALELAALAIGTYLGYMSFTANGTPMNPDSSITTNDSVLSIDASLASEKKLEELCTKLEERGADYADILKYVLENPEYKKELETSLTDESDSERLASSLLKSDAFPQKEILYLGDSRTQGLLNSGTISEDKTVYGVGYGYKWLIGDGKFSSDRTNATGGAINGIEKLMKGDKIYDIVIWLGVNDLNGISAQEYFEVYKSLAEGNWQKHDLFIVGVGPVDDAHSKHAKNKNIIKFNEELEHLIENSGIPNIHYVDLGLDKNSIQKFDDRGVHYSNKDSINIQSIIATNVSSFETERREKMVSTFVEIVEKTKDIGKSNNQISLKLK